MWSTSSLATTRKSTTSACSVGNSVRMPERRSPPCGHARQRLHRRVVGRGQLMQRLGVDHVGRPPHGRAPVVGQAPASDGEYRTKELVKPPTKPHVTSDRQPHLTGEVVGHPRLGAAQKAQQPRLSVDEQRLDRPLFARLRRSKHRRERAGVERCCWAGHACEHHRAVRKSPSKTCETFVEDQSVPGRRAFSLPLSASAPGGSARAMSSSVGSYGSRASGGNRAAIAAMMRLVSASALR